MLASLMRDSRQLLGRGSTACALVILAGFALVYSLSFAAVYVEGDDASLVSYHTLGRNPQIQPPFAGYESMFDAMLALLPARERPVRIAAMGVTALCAPIFVYLMLLLAFDWNPDLRSCPAWAVTLAMLLAAPELFYLAMVLTPTLVAMTFLTGAHMVIRRATRTSTSPRAATLVLSAALFGLGAALRWDCVPYGGVVAADLFLRAGDRSGKPQRRADLFRLAMGWGALAGGCWLAAVVLSNGGFTQVFSTLAHSSPVGSMGPMDARAFLARV